MQEASIEFKQIIRTYVIRAVEVSREKGPAGQAEQMQQIYIRILEGGELEEAVINSLTSQELKTDFHHVLLLALLQELSKWSIEYYQVLRQRPAPIQTLISKSISVVESQPKFPTIVSKQNQLIAHLLTNPHTIENLENFKVLYRKLKDVKDFYPGSVRDSQRVLFSKTIEECISVVSRMEQMKVMEFIHSNICSEIEILEEGNDLLPSRLKILKKVIKSIGQRDHQQLHRRTAYIILHLSPTILTHPYAFGHLLSLYELIISRATLKDSLIPMILFEHVVLSNLPLAHSNNQLLFIDLLLNQLSAIFCPKYLRYFLRLYDWNFMAEGVCKKVIQIVFAYTEEKGDEKKTEYQMYARCLRRIIEGIENFLKQKILQEDIKLQGQMHGQEAKKAQGQCHQQAQATKQLTFYQVKKRQYEDIIEMMNKSPKKIFKKIQGCADQAERENLISKYVHVIRRSPHLQRKEMINILAANNQISRTLLQKYMKSLMTVCEEYDLQEFLRVFISNFFLSGQSQQIQRTIDHLTQFFYTNQKEHNQNIFKESDAAYTFANAIIILNTDLHNPKNERKMTLQSFVKICSKINKGQDLPRGTLQKTYSNLKSSQIHTYRDMTKLHGISYLNFSILTSDPSIARLSYYDQQMTLLQPSFFQQFAFNMLLNIVNEKEDKKLAQMVQRFEYDEKNFQCEIVEDLRKGINRRPELAGIVLEKIFEQANFRNCRVGDRVVAYFWLAVKVIQNFNRKVHPKKICELLVLTWRLRMELGDHLHTREKVELKRVKNCLKGVERKNYKKTFMDIFSNLLTNDSSQDQSLNPPKITKKVNYQGFGLAVVDVLQGEGVPKDQSIQYLISYLRNNQSKIFQQFISVLSLIFHLIHTSSITREAKQLFQQLLCLRESQISKRISSLQQKDPKKHILLQAYCKYWILKILFKKLLAQKGNFTSPLYPSDLLQQAVGFIDIADRVLLIELINQLKFKDEVPETIVDKLLYGSQKLTQQKDLEEVRWFIDRFKKEQKGEHQGQTLHRAKSLKEINEKHLQMQQVRASIKSLDNTQEKLGQKQYFDEESKRTQILKNNQDQSSGQLQRELETHPTQTPISQPQQQISPVIEQKTEPIQKHSQQSINEQKQSKRPPAPHQSPSILDPNSKQGAEGQQSALQPNKERIREATDPENLEELLQNAEQIGLPIYML